MNQRITLAQWQAASTEQRRAWLNEGVLIQEQDIAALNAIAFLFADPSTSVTKAIVRTFVEPIGRRQSND